MIQTAAAQIVAQKYIWIFDPNRRQYGFMPKKVRLNQPAQQMYERTEA